MKDRRLLAAVHNNAFWCDTVCRTHGRPGEFLDDIWLNRQETPPFYPNAVTLSPKETATHLAHVERLLAAAIPGEWGVKDSFRTLDLAPLGFEIVFEGQWLYRDPAAPRPAVAALPDVRWTAVTRDAELARWEQAWHGHEPGSRRIFLPALLAEPAITIIAGLRGPQIVAGAIASHSRNVTGVSNLFLPPAQTMAFRAGCLAAIAGRFPDRPLVGYEGGDNLAEMHTLGFTATGPVRIWVRNRAG